MMLRGLVRDGLHRVLDRFRISQVIMADGMELLIQFVHEGDSGGDIQIDDIGVRHAIEMLHQRAQAVSMTGYQHVLAAPHRWRDLGPPVWQEPRSSILQALRRGELILRHVFVAGIMAGVPWILRLQRRRSDIVTAPP